MALPRMRKTAVDSFRAEQAQKQGKKELDGISGFIRTLLGDDPLPTQNAIFYEPTPKDDVAVRAYMGQIGSGKSNLIGLIAITRALFQPGYKVGVGRADYNDLTGTTAVVLEQMLQRLPPGILLGRDKSPPMRWILRPIFDGPESTITFMGLKERPSSYDFHTFLVDEADEVDEKIARELPSRIRAPGYSDYLVLFAFNPPVKAHWLYKACTGKNAQDEQIALPWMKLYKGIPKENSGHLPKNYYESRAAKLSDDLYQRYIDNEWGSVFEGDPVYPEFKFLTHTREQLPYDETLPLMRWWDFGFNRPACLWVQPTREGGLRILLEEIGHMVEIRPFANRCVRLTNSNFWQHTQVLDKPWDEYDESTTDYGDPAVRQKKDTGSTLSVLLECGIRMRFIPGQKIRDGLNVCRGFLRTLTDDGEPSILISRKGCPVLIEALKGGYRLGPDGETPVKDGFYEHIADAFRYGVSFSQAGRSTLPFARDGSIPESLEYDKNFDRYGDGIS